MINLAKSNNQVVGKAKGLKYSKTKITTQQNDYKSGVKWHWLVKILLWLSRFVSKREDPI